MHPVSLLWSKECHPRYSLSRHHSRKFHSTPSSEWRRSECTDIYKLGTYMRMGNNLLINTRYSSEQTYTLKYSTAGVISTSTHLIIKGDLPRPSATVRRGHHSSLFFLLFSLRQNWHETHITSFHFENTRNTSKIGSPGPPEFDSSLIGDTFAHSPVIVSNKRSRYDKEDEKEWHDNMTSGMRNDK